MERCRCAMRAGAVSAALALALSGAAPALAADGFAEVTEEGGTAATEVRATIAANPIRVTVPVALYVVIPADGGEITPPSAGAYRIVNDGARDVRLVGVSTQAADGWAVAERDAVLPMLDGRWRDAGADKQLHMGFSHPAGSFTLASAAGGQKLDIAVPAGEGGNAVSFAVEGKVGVRGEGVLVPGAAAAPIASVTFTIGV